GSRATHSAGTGQLEAFFPARWNGCGDALVHTNREATVVRPISTLLQRLKSETQERADIFDLGRVQTAQPSFGRRADSRIPPEKRSRRSRKPPTSNPHEVSE